MTWKIWMDFYCTFTSHGGWSMHATIWCCSGVKKIFFKLRLFPRIFIYFDSFLPLGCSNVLFIGSVMMLSQDNENCVCQTRHVSYFLWNMRKKLCRWKWSKSQKGSEMKTLLFSSIKIMIYPIVHNYSSAIIIHAPDTRLFYVNSKKSWIFSMKKSE